jgi:hypothetical protein
MHMMIYKPLSITFGTPGVDVASEQVIGRDSLADSMWQTLEGSSIRLLSERRMGKTWLLRLAVARKPDWAIPISFDAEGAGSASELVWRLNEQLHAEKLIDDDWRLKCSDWFRRVLQRMQGQQVAGMQIPELDSWFSFLEGTCKRLAEYGHSRRPVLIIDELPFFLDKLIKASQASDAIRLLDVLRQLRQTLPAIRMVFCGSLGLHIVLNGLREDGYTGRPVNDMPPFEVPPLLPQDGRYLSGCLLLGAELACRNLDRCAGAVSEAACHVPFYIQHIVKRMREEQTREWTVSQIRRIPEEIFTAPGDPAEFKYYDSRLDQYYPDDVVERSRSALDLLSRESKGLHFDEILNLIRHSPRTLMIDGTALLDILQILRDDHYLVQEGARWRFKLDIVRRWWHQHRGGLGL